MPTVWINNLMLTVTINNNLMLTVTINNNLMLTVMIHYLMLTVSVHYLTSIFVKKMQYQYNVQFNHHAIIYNSIINFISSIIQSIKTTLFLHLFTIIQSTTTTIPSLIQLYNDFIPSLVQLYNSTINFISSIILTTSHHCTIIYTHHNTIICTHHHHTIITHMDSF